MQKGGLLESIRSRGFAVRKISRATQCELTPALHSWLTRAEFRFPPVVEKPPPVSAWPNEYRASFHTLMRLAVGAFADVLDELEVERKGRAERLPARLQAFRASLSPALQSSRGNDIAPFDTSFVNFFNYKHGFLGPHRDRCLITVVYTVVHPYYPSPC
jgi:hypothetical protein